MPLALILSSAKASPQALALGIIAGQTAFDALRDHDFSFSNYERRIRRSAIGSMMCRRHMVARRLYFVPKARAVSTASGWRYSEVLRCSDRSTNESEVKLGTTGFLRDPLSMPQLA